jgi:hypothetical protein
MTGFIGTSITIIINCNSSQLMTVYDLLHSLLDHERLFFHCDEWQTTTTAHTLNCLERRLSDESLLRQSQSQSHIATDGQLVSKSWCRAPMTSFLRIN